MMNNFGGYVSFSFSFGIKVFKQQDFLCKHQKVSKYFIYLFITQTFLQFIISASLFQSTELFKH